MKKSIFYGAVLLAILTGCTKEITQGIAEDGQHSFRINTTAPCLETDDVDTKASMKATIRLQWNDGDRISVVNLSTGKTMLGNLIAKVNGDRVSFEGELSGSIKVGDKMAAIYPSQNFSGIIAVPDIRFDMSSQTCASKDEIPFTAYSLFDCKTTGVVDVTSDFIVPLSFNQISLATIEADTKIDYVELTNVGDGITFHVNNSAGTLEITPSVGKVRISPESKMSDKNGTLFAYCALASSPASKRSITVKALPKIYYSSWAESAMSTTKFYTSVASNFQSQQYNDFMVSAPSSLEVGYEGGTVVFSITSNNIDWTVSSTPSLSINPTSGKGCDNLEVTVTVPKNEGSSDCSFLVSFQGGSDKHQFIIKQKADPQKEVVDFPDINLKKYMLTLFDDDEDGQISMVEAQNVQEVNCNNRNIADLTGLEKCTNLEYLNFSGNYVSEMILPNMTALEKVVAYGNGLENINITGDTALNALYIQDVSTNALSGISFSIDGYNQAEKLHLAFSGTKYSILNLTNNSALKTIDISENVQLEKLIASGNSHISEINVSPLISLTELDLHACGLTALDVETNLNLANLDCSYNKISSLNVDSNIGLVSLNCSNNSLSSLRITNNALLEKVDVSYNNLEAFNVRQNTNLKELYIANNTKISSLALKNNTLLEVLSAGNTALSDIDLSANIAVNTLNLSGCSAMHIIDIAVNKALVDLNVSSTSLASLDVSHNYSLSTLNVSSTSLASLDVSHNYSLSTLDVSNTSSLVSLDASNNSSLTTLNISSTSVTSLKCRNGVHMIRGSVSNPIKSLTAKWAYVDDVKSVFFVYDGKVKAVSTDESSKTWGSDDTMINATSQSDGVTNTDKMIASGSSAANWCRAKGEAWYLPAFNELSYLYSIQSTLNSTLSMLDEQKLGTGYYWSSTEENRTSAKFFNLYDGKSGSQNKTSQSIARAVRTL